MSVDRSLVIFYGIKGKYDDFTTTEEATEDTKYILPDCCDCNYYDNPGIDKVIIFSDGMSGEYSFFGYLLFLDDLSEWGDDAAFSIDVDMLRNVADKFELEAVRMGISKEDRKNARLHTFLHYH